MNITSLKEAIKHRRSYYSITNSSPVSDDEIVKIIEFAVKYVPSAFNSQSTRIILLLGENHQKLWEITKGTLAKMDKLSDDSRKKIDECFTAGYGTVLFYEDKEVVKSLQENFTSYKDKFPDWSHHTSAMHQFVIWTMLEDVGFGASLQHYNPLIDEEVSKEWGINPSWELIAQMPFGEPLQEPGEKESQPLESRIKVYK